MHIHRESLSTHPVTTTSVAYNKWVINMSTFHATF